MKAVVNAPPATRLKIVVRGAVQGVGFRPFVFRLASELRLSGWINNCAQGVFIEAEGPRAELENFLLRLETEKPPRSCIQSLEPLWLDPVGYAGFEIRKSEAAGRRTALILPDIATCPDCQREIFDPANRRYRYPFTNCTNCGPRFSILESLPYDRTNTSMKTFEMCHACQAEYDHPADRRFHAQPNACPVCGPRLEFWKVQQTGGQSSSKPDDGDRRDACPTGNAALLAAAATVRQGGIVAVKGIGGFHLMADARNDDAVRRLRERKHREEKPLALMFPTLASVKARCRVSPLEERLLRSPEAPIVLLRRLACPHPGLLPQEDNFAIADEGDCLPCIVRVHANSKEAETARSEGEFQENVNGCSLSPGERVRVRAGVEQTSHQIAPSVAPGNPNLGVMLPSNPLHQLFMAELGFPVVATSGNLSDEPICTDEREARERLRDVADVFLVHNRPIVRHVDDSIVRVMLDREMILRRARGYAPLPITLNGKLSTLNHQPTLAVGAHLKNSVALAVGPQAFISQHIGDLGTEQANDAFRRVIADFERLYDATPEVIAADLHPDYLSTKLVSEFPLQHSRPGKATGEPPRELQQRRVGVQHHIAHVLSCMAENELNPPVLGVSWDGTGYGLDGTIWGGEFLRVNEDSIERVAHLCPFRLPGGDAAVKEPRRAALGVLHELARRHDNLLLHLRQKVAEMFSPAEQAAVETMLARGVNSPECTSVGRLFDAVAALIGLRHRMRFEGQAAMDLEFALGDKPSDETYDITLADELRPIRLDWSVMIQSILADLSKGISAGEISARFHNGLAEAIVAVARKVGEERVALSGGCFQNRYLTERTVTRLRAEGFRPYWHQRVPPNDGGIALGQVVAARREVG